MKVNTALRMRCLIQLFEELREASSIDQQEAIMRKFQFPSLLKEIFLRTHSPLANYGIHATTIPKKMQSATLRDADLRLKEFLSILLELSKRTPTAEDTDALTKLFNEAALNERTIYEHILDKDLQRWWGITTTAVNRAFKDLIIHPIDFQLPEHYELGMQLEMPVWAEPLIEGVRIGLFASPSGDRGAFSVGYGDYTPVFRDHLDRLERIARRLKRFVQVDGICFGGSWEKTIACLGFGTNEVRHTKSQRFEKARSELRLLTFDAILGNRKEPLRRRKEHNLTLVVSRFENLKPAVEIIPHAVIENQRMLKVAFANARKRNLPGIVIKDPDAAYKGTRNASWLKMKEIATEDVLVLEVFRGGGRDVEESCGTLLCRRANGETLMVHDMSDKQRELLWASRARIIGQYCQIEFHADPQTPGQRTIKLRRLKADKA